MYIFDSWGAPLSGETHAPMEGIHLTRVYPVNPYPGVSHFFSIYLIVRNNNNVIIKSDEKVDPRGIIIKPPNFFKVPRKNILTMDLILKEKDICILKFI